MSADNYVKIRRFGPEDYRWGMWFMSDDAPDYSDSEFNHGPFKNPTEAAADAEEKCGIIEYGIEFEDNIFDSGELFYYREKCKFLEGQVLKLINLYNQGGTFATFPDYATWSKSTVTR